MTNFDFQTYFDEKILTVTRHPGGLTNDNFVVTTAISSYFFRLPKKSLEGLFNRNIEGKVLSMVKPLAIDIPFLYFNDENGIKISYFIPDLQNYDACQYSDKLSMVAKSLKKLHSLQKCCDFPFDYLDKLTIYKNSFQNDSFDLSAFIWLERSYQNYQDALTLCHNDCVNGNLVFVAGKSYLIDYEYAADHYPIFDLTSFTTENDLPPIERAKFYTLYYGYLNKKLIEDLVLFEKLQHYLWCHWALMMLEKEKATIYYDIALNKYNNLIQYQSFIL